ncbi:ABC transporter permease subunit [Helicobacter sp. MIT 14-3879]|uniref:ABC transporter permease subunit n=1 Tax=Helicobacter sp. MIT 14-3879 TaxID=2040649 RepID=UPI000E1F7358|nr:ABC transporter permease subunit [Helicobacter sp. MIT 14-3879]RDU61698.1 nickel ABC transporter permease subunit NikB [Helicobacter sp. MIT 14-3879]
MIRYIFYRIFHIVIILFFTSIFIFFLLRLNNTDPIAQYLIHSNLPSTPEIIEEIKQQFGLDKPIIEQYILWFKNAIFLDFGNSYITNRPVTQDFLTYLSNSLLLIFFGFLFIIIGSIPLGILSAMYKDRLPDFIIRVFCFIGVCIPNFWLAFLLIIIFCIYLEWLPPLGIDGIKSFILPCISISLMSLCINTRLIRSNMLEVKKDRHIIYAHLRGLSNTKISIKHIFFNAIIPIVTALGMHIGELIGAALIIETIFAIPGIGFYSLQGIVNHDYPIIQCFVILMCLVFTLCNLFVDILYAFLDPRVYKNIQED